MDHCSTFVAGPRFERLIRPQLPEGWELADVYASGEYVLVNLVKHSPHMRRHMIFSTDGGLWGWNEWQD